MMKLKSERGLSLVEATIILMVLATLTGVLSPSIMSYVDDARMARAKEDVEAIGLGVMRLLKDTGSPFLLEDGDVAVATRFVTNNRVDLLVGNGNVPNVDGDVDNSVATNLQATLTWGDSIAAAAPTNTTGGVQSVYDQLVSNGNAYVPSSASVDTRDPQVQSLGSYGLGWRGAYLSGIVGPDPWANRYVCNTAFLGTASDAGSNDVNGGPNMGWKTDAMCLSAGPNSLIETDLEDDDGGTVVAGAEADDDIIFVISGHGR